MIVIPAPDHHFLTQEQLKKSFYVCLLQVDHILKIFILSYFTLMGKRKGYFYVLLIKGKSRNDVCNVDYFLCPNHHSVFLPCLRI